MQGLRDVVLSEHVPVFFIKVLEKVGILTRREIYVKQQTEKLAQKIIDKSQDEYLRKLPIDKMGQA